MAVAETIWPSDLPAPQALKDWLSLAFAAADSKEDDSGDKLAALFTEDGTMYGIEGPVTGRQAISASRKTAWKIVSERKHDVLRVYTGRSDYSDILLIGRLQASLHNGNTVDTEFMVQIEFEGMAELKPKAKLYKVWADSAPWIQAMKPK